MPDKEKNDLGAAAVGAGVGALVGYAMRGKPVQAGEVDLTTVVSILNSIYDEIQKLIPLIPGGGGTVGGAGYPANVIKVRSVRVVIAVAGVAQRCPTVFVPEGMELKIKAGFSNLGVVYVAESQQSAQNINSSEPLVRNEFTLYQIKDAYECWVTSTRAGDFVTLTAEQPQQGGA